MASRRRGFSITIPAEIITEILYRLPAKSIGRFRCVSKSWLSQLTHPNFIKIHLNNNNTFSHQNHLIFKTPHDKSFITEKPLFLYSHPFHSREVVVTTPTKFDLQLNSNPFFANVYGSCDGLVLFGVRCATHFTATMMVINPTTKECLQLPQEQNYKLCVCMGSVYGFGYDSVTDDYKVVSLTHSSHVNNYDGDFDEKVYVDVYSLRNKKWRRVTDSPYDYLITPPWGSYGVFFNGFIHWIVSMDDDDGSIGIAAFSLADEWFSKIPFPKHCNTLKSLDCELFVLGGKLAFIIREEGVVWLMNEYGLTESWTKILLHGIDKLPFFEPDYYPQLSMFDDNGKILVANNDRMMVYEVEKATFTETVCVWNPEKFCIGGLYLESLVSPKLGKEEENKDDNAEENKDDNEEGVSESEADDDAEDENEEDGSEEDDAADGSEEDDEDTPEGIEFFEEDDDKNVEDESRENDAYDSWKAKHQEEKLRADRLEEALNHALSKQQFLNHCLEENEATVQSKLIEIQALERRSMKQDEEVETLKARSMEQDDEIESLKARLALADEERRKAIAALSLMAKNTLN